MISFKNKKESRVSANQKIFQAPEDIDRFIKMKNVAYQYKSFYEKMISESIPDPFYESDDPEWNKDEPFLNHVFSPLRISQLCHSVQKHNCSSYCLKRNKCRFDYPRKLSLFTKIKVGTKTRSQQIYFKVTFPRNHSRVGAFNPKILSNLSANTDMQSILDPSAVVNYLTKYVCKSEPPSDFFRKISSKNFNTSSNPDMSRLFSFIMNSLFSRDISSAEAQFYFLNGKIWSSTL